MKRKKRLVCALLVLCLLLSGCQLDFAGYFQKLGLMTGYQTPASYAQMTYTHPDMTAIRQVLNTSCNTAMNSKNLQDVINGIYAYYDVYDSFYTNYNLAYIHYCQNMTDIYWEDEYTYCMENASQMDAGLDELFYTLADSPWREALEGEDYFGADYFDAYEGESIYDGEFMALMEGEAQLLSEYYAIYEQSLSAEPYSEEYFSSYGTKLADIFVRLIAQRQKIAAWAGYDSYPQFAYDFYYYRDYTPEQAQTYLSSIPEQLEPLYRRVNQSDLWTDYGTYCSEAETFAFGSSTASAMGGKIQEAFEFMAHNGVYDISYAPNKYSTSFELYLYSYASPFLFVSPVMDPSDKLTFVHEFGHFVNDYICYGSGAGTDVAEVHSQTMEYLSLLYGEGGDTLTRLKMATCLSIYVDQAAYALFEHQVYNLTGDDLTAENVGALYEQIGLQFGFDSWAWDSRDYVCIEHFFTNPLYVVSYVASNDLALQIYQKELETGGAGLELYRSCLESQESFLLTFAESYSLQNPFAEDRITQVRKTLEEALK